MEINREQLAHAYRRAKNFGHSAFNTTAKVLHTTDKLAVLGARGLRVIAPRLDPEIFDAAHGALASYHAGRKKLNNVVDNVGHVNRASKSVGFEF